MEKTGVAIVGFGNIGQYAAKALQEAENMELRGVVEISDRLEYGRRILPDVTFAEDISKIDDVEIAILCLPSLMVPAVASNILKQGINTVDCFDMHGDDLVALKTKLHALSVENEVVSIINNSIDSNTALHVFNHLTVTVFTYLQPFFFVKRTVGRQCPVRSFHIILPPVL